MTVKPKKQVPILLQETVTCMQLNDQKDPKNYNVTTSNEYHSDRSRKKGLNNNNIIITAMLIPLLIPVSNPEVEFTACTVHSLYNLSTKASKTWNYCFKSNSPSIFNYALSFNQLL